MLKQPNAETTAEDENTTKEVVHGRIGRCTYVMTTVTHHKDGKSIVYRRSRRGVKGTFQPFDVTKLTMDDRVQLGLGLMLSGWDVTQVAAFVGMPLQAFRSKEDSGAKI